MSARFGSALAVFAAIALVAIFLHGPIPLYSTRTLGVAWEMWARGDFILPVQNGLPYSHKPPTLYWLIHSGWALFGVSDVWPRVLVVLLAATAGGLTVRLAARLDSKQAATPAMAAWILLSGVYFFLFAQQIMFELLLVIAVLLCWLSALGMIRGERHAAFKLAASMALGLLTKGPVIYLHVLPGLLLLPWVAARCAQTLPAHWRRSVLLCALGAALLALCWAVPAALKAGSAFAQQLLIEQTTGRVTQAFDHARPLWWYLPWLLVLGSPWVWQWSSWRAARIATRAPLQFPSALLLAWCVPAFVGFCLVSGKQVYYLLPLMPALAILLARGLNGVAVSRPWLLCALFALLGLALLAFSQGLLAGGESRNWHAGLQAHSLAAGLAVLLIAGLLLIPCASSAARTALTASATLSLLLVLKLLFTLSAWPAFDLAPAAAKIAALSAKGHRLASIEYYEGQYHFAARLTQPIVQLKRDQAMVDAWAQAHPQDYLLVYPTKPTVCAIKPAYRQAFRNQQLEIWRAADWRQCGSPLG